MRPSWRFVQRGFPNYSWGWRHPIRKAAWEVAWWLMREVAMRGYTRRQQAYTIDRALGRYRPIQPITTSAAANVTVHYREPYA